MGTRTAISLILVNMMRSISVNEIPNHFLIFGVVFFGFMFKKFDARLAKQYSYLYIFILHGELFRRRQEIINFCHFANRHIYIFNPFHNIAPPFSNSPRQKSELFRRGM